MKINHKPLIWIFGWQKVYSKQMGLMSEIGIKLNWNMKYKPLTWIFGCQKVDSKQIGFVSKIGSYDAASWALGSFSVPTLHLDFVFVPCICKHIMSVHLLKRCWSDDNQVNLPRSCRSHEVLLSCVLFMARVPGLQFHKQLNNINIRWIQICAQGLKQI